MRRNKSLPVYGQRSGHGGDKNVNLFILKQTECSSNGSKTGARGHKSATLCSSDLLPFILLKTVTVAQPRGNQIICDNMSVNKTLYSSDGSNRTVILLGHFCNVDTEPLEAS